MISKTLAFISPISLNNFAATLAGRSFQETANPSAEQPETRLTHPTNSSR